MKLEIAHLLKTESIKNKVQKKVPFSEIKILSSYSLEDLLKELMEKKPSIKFPKESNSKQTHIKLKINKEETVEEILKETLKELNIPLSTFNPDIKTLKTKIIHKSINNPLLKGIINTKDFKEIKSLNDLIKVSKKYNLNLLKIALSKEEPYNPFKIVKTSNLPFSTITIVNLKNRKSINNSFHALHNSFNNSSNLIKEKKEEFTAKIQNNKTQNNKNNIKNDFLDTEEILKELINKQTNTNSLEKHTNKAINSHKQNSLFDIIIAKAFSTDKNIKEEKKESSNNKYSNYSTIINTINHSTNNSNISISHKETIHHFTNSLKDSINEYKPPITKLSLELHPKELGKVEITLKQRGDELHVQINSNNQNTINFFSLNQQELKNSLVNMGFTNINMNFNSSNENKKQHQDHKPTTNTKKIDNEEELPLIELNYKYA